MTDLLEVKDLRKVYQKKGQGKQETIALAGVNFSLHRGEILGVIGESGCGKSTLSRILVGLEKATAGEVLTDGEMQQDLLKKDALAFRRKVQMVFQNPYDVFDGRHRLEEILRHPLKLHNIGGSKEERDSLVQKALTQAGLVPWQDFKNRYPHELSGGQLQRLAILRAVLLNPELLLADEPVTMLDVSLRAGILEMLRTMQQELNMGILFISHDIATVATISHRIMVMYLGHLVEIGRKEELIQGACHPYTQALLFNSNTLREGHLGQAIYLKGEASAKDYQGRGCPLAPRCPRASQECFTELPEEQKVSPSHSYRCFHPFC